MAEQRLAKLVHSLQELVFGSRLSHNLVTTVSAGAYDAISRRVGGLARDADPGTSTSGGRSSRCTEGVREKKCELGQEATRGRSARNAG